MPTAEEVKVPSSMKYVIATIKSWNIEEAKRFISANPDLKILLLTDEEKLTYQKIKNFNPKYIFFPHWSWLIPEKIHRNYECVIFHMTDLPFGRGGSPLQNLIDRGINKTRISAVRVIKELDAGPIYLKRNLPLNGSAEEIFKRASKIIFRDMIPYILRNKPQPVSQVGKVMVFKRKTPNQSKIANLNSLKKIYDYIRMLDAEGYPSAFIETPYAKIEFSGAKQKKNYILADAKITIKGKR